MNIYIIHYKELKDRRKYLESKLNGFNYIFIDEYDRNTLDLNNIHIKFNNDLWFERIKNLYQCPEPYRIIEKSEMCNALSHLDAIRKISESDDVYNMIIEDDVILPPDFFDKIENMLLKTPPDFDFIFFGNSFSLSILDNANFSKSIKVNENIYKKEPGKTRCVDGYIVSREAAKKITKEFTEFCLPFDIELNYFLNKFNMNVYWNDPGIIYQGSQMGHYSSSIR